MRKQKSKTILFETKQVVIVWQQNENNPIKKVIIFIEKK